MPVSNERFGAERRYTDADVVNSANKSCVTQNLRVVL